MGKEDNMKKILMWLTVLALMLTSAAFADQENAPVMLVKLPEDAQMVENVAFDDGDFIQTYQLSGGAYVQLLRYAQGDVTLDGIVAGDWPGATDIQSMALETVGGYAAKGLMLSVEPEDEEAVRVALVLVSADRCALVYQAVYPQRLGDDQIDDAVQRMVDSMDVLGGSTAKDVG